LTLNSDDVRKALGEFCGLVDVRLHVFADRFLLAPAYLPPPSENTLDLRGELKSCPALGHQYSPDWPLLH